MNRRARRGRALIFKGENERVPAFVFLPKNTKPPYQALVYSPGAGAVSSTFASMDGFNRIEFIIRSGRAVIYPVYIGTFSRRLPSTASEIELKEPISGGSRTCGRRLSTW